MTKATLLLAASLPLLIDGFSLKSSSPVPLAYAYAKPSSALSSTAASAVDNDASSTSKFWKWRGHDIFTEVRTPQLTTGESTDDAKSSKKRPSVILLHGFGASTKYWRETMNVLHSEGYDVHALDFLGQGRSSKPYAIDEYPTDGFDDNYERSPFELGENGNTKVEYSINLWANLVDDYARHRELEDVVLMGNSLGSLVALSAATGDFGNEVYLAADSDNEKSRVKGLCLFNCGVGLNSRNVVKNPSLNEVQRVLINKLFDVLNSLIFDNATLLRYALNNVVTKELLEDALKSLYIVSPDRVDQELVDSFYYPAIMGGEGSVEAIRQIYCNDAGLTPLEYHAKYPQILDKMPLHLIWGLDDAVTPIEGDVGMFYCDRVANNRGGKGMTTINTLKSGHMPFDDNPEEAHDAMIKWLNRRIAM